MIYKNCIPKNINQINNFLHIRRFLSDDKKLPNTKECKDVEENMKVKILIFLNLNKSFNFLFFKLFIDTR